jgi:hypothetical protein
MYLTLAKATDIKRDKFGIAWSWVNGEIIKHFDDDELELFLTFVKDHITELTGAVVLSGSANFIRMGNEYLADQLIKAKLLKVEK